MLLDKMMPASSTQSGVKTVPVSYRMSGLT